MNDLIGKEFKTNQCGALVIINYKSASCVGVRFNSTGYTTTARLQAIRSGQVKDRLHPSVHGVGFVGDGSFKPSENSRNTAAYEAWSHMLTRCYSDAYHKTRPTYKDCVVCDEWKNFQVFAKWFYENNPRDGKSYDLDKDIMVEGNKIYSPDFCQFVTKEENAKKSSEHMMKPRKVINPNGDIIEFTNINDFCLEYGISKSSAGRLARGEVNQHKGWRSYNG